MHNKPMIALASLFMAFAMGGCSNTPDVPEGGPSSRGRALAGATTGRGMIIDCHTHLNNYTDESIHSLPEDLSRLQAIMRRNRRHFHHLQLCTRCGIPPRPRGLTVDSR